MLLLEAAPQYSVEVECVAHSNAHRCLGCLVDGRPFVIGQELRLSNGCTFMCHPQSNVYVCDEKLGNWTIDENQVQRSPAVIKFKTAL